MKQVELALLLTASLLSCGEAHERTGTAADALWMCCKGMSMSTGAELDWCGDVAPDSAPPNGTMADVAAGEAVAAWFAAGQFPDPDDVTCGPFSIPHIDGIAPSSGSFYFFRCTGRARVMAIPPLVIQLRWSGYRESLEQAYVSALTEWDAQCQHEVWACVVIEEETFCHHSSIMPGG